MSSSKFAQQQLSKHGWKEGSGLGKSEDGITEAIKVKLKHDTHGVGHNKGDEFAFHWWDHVFNKAANNISVNSTEDGVELSKMKNSNKVSTTTTKTYDNKAMLYGKFLKGATLSNGNYEATNEEDSDDEEEQQKDTKATRIQDLDDDVLLKACGGMTAHKAARHGHKLNGKLARIQEQEALLLAKYKSGKTTIKDQDNVTGQVKCKETDDEILQTDNTTDEKDKKRKNKKKDKSEKKKRKREKEELECDIKQETTNTDIVGIPTKRRSEESSESGVEDTDAPKKMKREKKRKNKEKSEIVVEDIVCDEESNRKKKKDKKRKSEVFTTESVSNVTDSKKKKKKDNLKTQFCDDSETSSSKNSDEYEVKDSRATKRKKSKKQKKEKACD